MIPVMIVPVLTNPALLYQMLQSMDMPAERLIVIDNGDVLNPVTLRHAARGMKTTLLTPGANLGVAGSWNLGIKCAPFAPWWLVCNFDITWPTNSLGRFAVAARRDALVLSAGAPPWCAFAVGDQVVSRVGLFDESLHPGYFEDNDYERRVRHWGMDVVLSDIPVRHQNSSTIKDPRYAARNDKTFVANREHYMAKMHRGDVSAGEWSLSRRRELSWD